MKSVEYLADWLVRFLKNRDIYFKRIKNLEQRGNIVLVEEAAKTTEYRILSFDDNLKKTVEDMKEDRHYGLVMYNTEDNFKALFAVWKSLIKIRHLVVYFVNPLSKTEKKWIIYPATHDRISEDASLKPGLRAMFGTVEAISKKDVERILG